MAIARPMLATRINKIILDRSDSSTAVAVEEAAGASADGSDTAMSAAATSATGSGAGAAAPLPLSSHAGDCSAMIIKWVVEGELLEGGVTRERSGEYRPVRKLESARMAWVRVRANRHAAKTHGTKPARLSTAVKFSPHLWSCNPSIICPNASHS